MRANSDSGYILEIIRLAYLQGISDQQEDCACWCREGSRDRALELIDDIMIEASLKNEHN